MDAPALKKTDCRICAAHTPSPEAGIPAGSTMQARLPDDATSASERAWEVPATALQFAEKVHFRRVLVAQALLPVLCLLLLSHQRTAKSGCATDFFRKLFNRLRKTPKSCHSEEPSDEESLFFLAFSAERFLAPLGMTAGIALFSIRFKPLVQVES